MDHSEFIQKYCMRLNLVRDGNQITIACCYNAQRIFDAILNAFATGNDIVISYHDNYDLRLSNDQGSEK